MGNFLEVQWLGLSAFTEVARIQALVGELRPRKLHAPSQKKDANELTYKIETDLHRKQTYGYKRGKGCGRDKLGVWD